jgi:lipopolysaccharide transport system ATP-binding protein
MEGDVVIRVEGLGKKYLIGHQAERERYVTLRDVLARTAQHTWRKTSDMVRGRAIIAGDTTEEFWALKDVSFEVKRGEVVGVIGRNGAGKSTLLKILSRITEPTDGQVTLVGRVASLLEVGTGFHPELTGRENIYLNGAVLGMSRAEIRKKFDEIVAFSEVEKFLDTPVKRYSSGMYVRLAFAVAAHLEPEILIVDEVLAVGDMEFQKKCLGKLSEVAIGGRTVLFVSHNMSAIDALCPRSMYLVSGSLVGVGATADIVPMYLADREAKIRWTGENAIKIHDGLVLERVRCTPNVVSSGSRLDIDVLFHSDRPGLIRECAVLIYSIRGARIALVDIRDSGELPFRYAGRQVMINVHFKTVHLVEGAYVVGLYLVTDHFRGDLLDLAEFSIVAGQSSKYVPYPAGDRGFLAMQATSLISSPAEVESQSAAAHSCCSAHDKPD